MHHSRGTRHAEWQRTLKACQFLDTRRPKVSLQPGNTCLSPRLLHVCFCCRNHVTRNTVATEDFKYVNGEGRRGTCGAQCLCRSV